MINQYDITNEGASVAEWLKTYPDCVGPGWRNLVLALHDELSDDYKVYQIKEKFGGLRVYGRTENEDPAIKKRDDAYIALASARSYEICEQCGEHGNIRSEMRDRDYAWIRTLCKLHAEEMGYVVDE